MSAAAALLGAVLILTPSQSLSDVTASQYVEYLPSSGLPVILSAPHGGFVRPYDVPDRDAGCWTDQTNCTWTHNCGVKNPQK